jgi:CoA:oxalate CoA-transferase
LKELNPKLIYASISGFGLDGPDAGRPCYDIVAQAMGGIMSMTGFENEIVKVGPAIADNYSGTYLALGICMALYQRERTGLGRRIDVSMVDTIFSILETGVVQYTIGGKIPEPEGNRDPVIAPFDAFRGADGMCVIACGTDKFFTLLCETMGRPELSADIRFSNNSQRCENYAQLKPIIEAWTEQHTVDELETLIVAAGIPFGKIQNTAQACESSLTRQRNMLWSIDDPAIGQEIQVPGTPIKMHGCQDKAERPAPMLGQHSSELLVKLLHKSPEEIDRLKIEKVI